MIRLKQKKAEEEKKASEEASVAETQGVTTPSSSAQEANPDTEITSNGDEGSNGGGLKLLGIGGKGARTGTVTKVAGKKRTPGEIRIQKGQQACCAKCWFIQSQICS